MLMASAEGTLFEVAGGRYSQKTTLEVYLHGYSGESMEINRRGAPHKSIDRAAVSVAVMVQPSILAKVVSNDTMAAQGFLGRFAYSQPRSMAGHRPTTSVPISPETRDLYNTCMRLLWVCGSAQPDVPTPIRLTPAAEVRFNQFCGEIEAQLGEGGALAWANGWPGRLPGSASHRRRLPRRRQRHPFRGRQGRPRSG